MTQPAAFNTPSMAIRQALFEAGKLQEGDDPSSETFARAMSRLNAMLLQWQTKGLKLWAQQDLAITLTAGTALYSFGPTGTVVMARPFRINIGAYYLQSDGVTRRPLITLGYDEYIRLSNVQQQGSINSYFVDKQQTNLNVFFWLTPDSNEALGTPHIIIQTQLAKVAAVTDTISFPEEWFQAIIWGLAEQLCTGMPQAIVTRCSTTAKEYREDLENWDVEDASTKFEPDQRSLYNQGQFR